MIKPLLTLNKLNANNRMYRTDVVEKAITEYVGKEAYLEHSQTRESPEVNIENVIGVVTDMYIKDDLLLGNIDIISRCPPVLKEGFESGEFVVRPFGIGTIDEHRQVQDYKLVGFILTNDPA